VEARRSRRSRRRSVERRDDIAAIIIEPIQAEGGDNHFRGEFLRALRQLCDENEALLIFDEVQTGVGLTGRFWAHEHFGVSPTWLRSARRCRSAACSPARGSTRSRERLPRLQPHQLHLGRQPGGHGASQRYLEIIEEENLVEPGSSAPTCTLAAEFPGKVGNVRGKGLFIAFDLPDGATRAKVLSTWLQKHAVMGLASGENAIRLRPALTLTKEEALLGVQRLRLTLTEVLG
jgi:L-lysine 6-transaminase